MVGARLAPYLKRASAGGRLESSIEATCAHARRPGGSQRALQERRPTVEGAAASAAIGGGLSAPNRGRAVRFAHGDAWRSSALRLARLPRHARARGASHVKAAPIARPRRARRRRRRGGRGETAARRRVREAAVRPSRRPCRSARADAAAAGAAGSARAIASGRTAACSARHGRGSFTRSREADNFPNGRL